MTELKKIDRIEMGQKIRILRKKKNWTQLDLANETGLGITSIREIEKGIRNPTIVTINCISAILGVEPQELFTVIPIEI